MNARCAITFVVGTAAAMMLSAVIPDDSIQWRWFSISDAPEHSDAPVQHISGGGFQLAGRSGHSQAALDERGDGYQLMAGISTDARMHSMRPKIASVVACHVDRGERLDGDAASIASSDGTWLIVRSGRGTTLADLHSTEVRLVARARCSAPAAVRISVESRIGEPSGLGELRVRNWTTDQFDLVHSYAVHDAETTAITPNIDAAHYVDVDGNIELVVKYMVPVLYNAPGFDAFFDVVEIVVE